MKTSDKMIAELEKNIANEADDLKSNADSVADLQDRKSTRLNSSH